MTPFLKQAVSAALPTPLLSRVIVVRERLRLARIPRSNFNARHLKAIARSDVEAAFTDQAISAAWEEDLSRIGKVMPYADIYGGVCPGERRAIYHLVASLRPRRVLEIGTHIGASTLVIAQSLARHAGRDSLLVTGDILDVNNPDQGACKDLGLQPPRENLRRLGIENQVSFATKPALQLMKELAPEFDLIFLDGDHSAPAVYQELSMALNRIAKNGVVLLHDFYPGCRSIYPSGMIVPGPSLAADRIRSETAGPNFLPLGELPWETKLGVRKTSLALVVRS